MGMQREAEVRGWFKEKLKAGRRRQQASPSGLGKQKPSEWTEGRRAEEGKEAGIGAVQWQVGG